MIDSSKVRNFYQRLFVDKLAASLSSYLTPQTITLSALAVGILVLPLLALEMPYFALACLLLSGYLDSLDGTLARMKKATSPQGAVLDIVSDRIVEAAVIIGLFFVSPATRALPAILMLTSVLVCVTSFLVVGIFTENSSDKSFHYSPGLMERAEAFLLFAAMILFPSLFLPFAYLFTILVFYTACRRVFQFLRLF
jgi:archaetidylinositol phosphate synthase